MKKSISLTTSAMVLFAILSQSALAIQTKEVKVSKSSPTQKLALIGTDSTGKKIDLSALTGKTVLVSFYSAGCTVCARDIKLMREFYRDNMTKNFILIGLNTEKNKADFNSYSALLELNTPKNEKFPMIWRGGVEKLEGFGKIVNDPTHFVINSKGAVVLKREGTFKAEDWDNLWEWINN